MISPLNLAMIKKYNCFVSALKDKFFLFSPHSLATAIIDNPNGFTESDFLLALSEQQVKELFENDVFISDKCDAYSMGKYYSDKLKYKKSLVISDTMTFSCNMDCVYCFENRTKKIVSNQLIGKRMGEIVKLIDLYLSDIEHLDYVFFGGEPLLDVNYILSIADFLTKRYPMIRIDFSLTSNGTLINDKFIELCKKYNFKEIRITIDGPAQVHNLRRIMKNHVNSYNIILENIKKLCENTNITVIINTVLDDNNAKYYFEMVADLIEKFEKYIFGDTPQIVFNVGMLCHPVFDTSYTENKETANSSGSSLYYTICERLIEMGATITSPYYSAHCMNSAEKDFTIAPNGGIYKCVTGVGSERFLLSSYDDFISDPVLLIRKNICQIEQSHGAACWQCDYLTMCNGGCKCQHYEKGDILCRKKVFENEMESFMRLLFLGTFTEKRFFKKRE